MGHSPSNVGRLWTRREARDGLDDDDSVYCMSGFNALVAPVSIGFHQVHASSSQLGGKNRKTEQEKTYAARGAAAVVAVVAAAASTGTHFVGLVLVGL